MIGFYHEIGVTLYTEVLPSHIKQVSWLKDLHVFFSFSYKDCTMDLAKKRSLITVTGSLRIYTWFPFLDWVAGSDEHFIPFMELYLNIITASLLFVNSLIFFWQATGTKNRMVDMLLFAKNLKKSYTKRNTTYMESWKWKMKQEQPIMNS